jgi:hypothetical protein
MKEELPESTKRLRKIGLGIFVVLSLLSGFMIWQVDLFHLHFGYRDAKEEYLRSGMPWTSEDLYSGITPEQAKKRAELFDSGVKAVQSYELDGGQRYEEVARINAERRLKESASANVHLDRMADLSGAPLLGMIDLNEGIYSHTQSLSPMKEAIQLLVSRGEWNVAVGRFEDGFIDFRTAYQLANSLGNSEAFMSYIIGNASLAVTDLSLVKAAGVVRGNPRQLKALEELMGQSLGSYPLAINAFKGEALTYLAYARNADILKDASTLIFQSGFPGEVNQPVMTSGDPRTMGRRSLAVAFMKLWSGVGDSIKSHPEDQEKWFAALRSETARAVKKGGMAGQMIDFSTPNPDIILDGLKRSKTMRLVNLSLLRGARMSLEGKAQSQIEAAMERDPYSEQPLVWKSNGSTFTVYSVGPNGADDGGISRADYQKLKGGSSVTGADAYDVPATIPWKPEPRPSSTGYSHLSGEDR